MLDGQIDADGDGQLSKDDMLSVTQLGEQSPYRWWMAEIPAKKKQLLLVVIIYPNYPSSNSSRLSNTVRDILHFHDCGRKRFYTLPV